MLALVAATSAVAVAGAASADTLEGGTVTWSVAPAPTEVGARESFEFTVEPGTQLVDAVIVTNRGDVPATFTISAADALNDPDSGALGLSGNAQAASDAGSWITTSVDEITLDPGNQASIPFSIVIPSDATPGNHLAGIVATLGAATQDEPAPLQQRVAARVYLTVLGEIASSVSISNITTEYSTSLFPFAPGDFSIEFDVTNDGNLVVDAYPSVALTGIAGVSLGDQQVAPLKELLPGQRVRVVAVFGDLFPAGFIWSAAAVSSEVPEVKREEITEPIVGGQTATPIPLESAVPEAISTGLDPTFDASSTTTMTAAISWSAVILVGVIVLGLLLTRRFQAWSRKRLHSDIDDVTRERKKELTIGGAAS